MRLLSTQDVFEHLTGDRKSCTGRGFGDEHSAWEGGGQVFFLTRDITYEKSEGFLFIYPLEKLTQPRQYITLGNGAPKSCSLENGQLGGGARGTNKP